jgi:putative Mg2+ transporter-C (MgtC) family protein
MNTWQEIGNVIRDEFSDIPDVNQFVRIVVRLLIAATLGGILGFEREQMGKAAGLRTHMLVALGAAMFVLIPKLAGTSDGDMARVFQGIVIGVGFLGTGTIIKGDDETQIEGLTTAAGIWLTAAIGIAAGVGRETTAIVSTLLALFILWSLPKAANLFVSPAKKQDARPVKRNRKADNDDEEE